MTPCRATALMKLGGACVCCGNRQLSLLEFDHEEDGQGNAHRRRIYPLTLEKVLANSGYPQVLEETVDGQVIRHRISLKCQRCHRSKTKHGRCQIDHDEDMMTADETQEIPEDTTDVASSEETRPAPSKKRQTPEAQVRLSTWVAPHIKEWLDRQAEQQGMSLGKVLAEMKKRLEQGDIARHSEEMTLLREIKVEIKGIRLASALQVEEPAPKGEFDHLNGQPQIPSRPALELPVYQEMPAKKRGWFGR